MHAGNFSYLHTLAINFYLESADFSGNINLTCYDWSIEFERKTGWIDSLTVSIDPWNSLKVIIQEGMFETIGY